MNSTTSLVPGATSPDLLPIEVRRGQRRQPLTLLWEGVTGQFLPVACPYGGSGERLVAGRDRLGCRACLPRPAQPPVPASRGQVHAGPAGEPATPKAERVRAPATESGSRPPAAGQLTLELESAIPPPKAKRTQGRRRAANGEGDSLRDKDFQDPLAGLRRDSVRVDRVGSELAFKFWDRALVERQRWRRVAAGSPLDVLYEVLGDSAPLHVIGISRGEEPEGVEWESHLVSSALHAVTLGTLTTTGAQHDFVIRWRLVDGRPVVSEVLPDNDALTKPRLWPHLFSPPTPRGLDAAARRLWEVEIPLSGLAFVARCLSNRRYAGSDWEAGAALEVVAAALALRTGRSIGRLRKLDQVASEHEVDEKELGRTDRRLRQALETSSGRN